MEVETVPLGRGGAPAACGRIEQHAVVAIALPPECCKRLVVGGPTWRGLHRLGKGAIDGDEKVRADREVVQFAASARLSAELGGGLGDDLLQCCLARCDGGSGPTQQAVCGACCREALLTVGRRVGCQREGVARQIGDRQRAIGGCGEQLADAPFDLSGASRHAEMITLRRAQPGALSARQMVHGSGWRWQNVDSQPGDEASAVSALGAWDGKA
jgi:hypothetical protein